MPSLIVFSDMQFNEAAGVSRYSYDYSYGYGSGLVRDVDVEGKMKGVLDKIKAIPCLGG